MLLHIQVGTLPYELTSTGSRDASFITNSWFQSSDFQSEYFGMKQGAELSHSIWVELVEPIVIYQVLNIKEGLCGFATQNLRMYYQRKTIDKPYNV